MGLEGSPADGQAQAKATGGAIAAAVETVKGFEDTLALVQRNADAIVIHPDLTTFGADLDAHLNALVAVTRGIAQQVLQRTGGEARVEAEALHGNRVRRR